VLKQIVLISVETDNNNYTMRHQIKNAFNTLSVANLNINLIYATSSIWYPQQPPHAFALELWITLYMLAAYKKKAACTLVQNRHSTMGHIVLGTRKV
jgi:hypothetical protein